MIIEIFLLLLALVVLVVLLGYFTDDAPYLSIGLFFLFLLSMVVLTGSLEFRTGYEAETVFTYDNSSLASQTETLTTTYAVWDDGTSRQVGIWLAILSVVGFSLSLVGLKRNMRDD